jgi:hypothetical protein
MVFGLLSLFATDNAYATQVSIGMMRWDAWSYNATAGSAYQQAKHSISQTKWNALGYWPWWAKVDGKGALIEINEDTQAIIDQENQYAYDSQISYWSFLKYPESSTLNRAFKKYLSSSKKHLVKCSFIINSTQNATDEFDAATAYITTDPQYFSVNGRALTSIYPYGMCPADQVISHVRGSVRAAGKPNPYIVLYNMDGFGEDARSEYSPGIWSGSHGRPYSVVSDLTRSQWSRSTSKNYVPNGPVGWDSRPYAERRPNWYPNPVDDCWYVPATEDEYRQMLQDAVDYVIANPARCPAQTITSKEWKGFTEGGNVAPSLARGTSYIDAIKLVNRFGTGESDK